MDRSSLRPLVGISACLKENGRGGWHHTVGEKYVRAAIHAVGGLPIRRPGAQLVPGGLAPVEEASVRDPDEIRNNLTRHLSGVRSGRAEAQYNDGGLV